VKHKAFSETDQIEDLKKFDVPTLVLHGEEDQIVPVKDSVKKSATRSSAPKKSIARRATRPNRYASGPG
jgi:fermentation-respiration switch protein FrsA (DUF1100 family)